MIKKIDKVADRVSDVCSVFLVAAGVTMVVLTFLTAVARKIGISSLTWTDEVNRYCFIYMTYIGMIVCTQKGRHAGVDLIFDYVKGRAAALLRIVGYVLIIIFLYILFNGAVSMIGTAGITLSPVLHIPLSIIYFSLIIGSVLTILNYVWMIVKCGLVLINGEKEETEAC